MFELNTIGYLDMSKPRVSMAGGCRAETLRGFYFVGSNARTIIDGI
jgi:hypothetical protein